MACILFLFGFLALLIVVHTPKPWNSHFSLMSVHMGSENVNYEIVMVMGAGWGTSVQ